MKQKIINGSNTLEILVTEEMLASFEETVIHPVYSTFWLCYHVELCARKTIEPYFDEDENALGGGIEITHKGMAPLGAIISITTRVLKLSEKTIVCEFVVFHRDILLATGFQTQHYFTQKTIDNLVKSAYDRL